MLDAEDDRKLLMGIAGPPSSDDEGEPVEEMAPDGMEIDEVYADRNVPKSSDLPSKQKRPRKDENQNDSYFFDLSGPHKAPLLNRYVILLCH